MKPPPCFDLHNIEAVGLDELIGVADLVNRFDVKYLVASDDVAAVVEELHRRCRRARVLDIDGRRHQRCLSNYFDTPELQLYRAHVQGRRRRYKVRTRSYNGERSTMFEVKL